MNPIEPTTRLPLGRRSAFWFRCAWLLLGLALCFVLPSSTVASSTIFGGGPFYYGGTSTMNTLRASGYSTVMLWTLHVYADSAGSLIYNDQLVVANGVYVGNAGWPAQLATLKTAPTSVKRLEWSVGSWGANDFLAIKTLMDTYGTNTDSLLYRNFLALKNATGADAVDFDDETQYDVATAVKFGRMLSAIGYKVTLCPYTNPGFWQSVYNQLGTGIVDAVYLQCYAGGAGNNPATWNGYFTGLKVQPGMWCMNGSSCSSGSTAGQVQAQMFSWVGSAGISGGFMWLYDDMLSCNNGGSPADYAMAINSAINQMTPPVVTATNLSLTNGSFAPLATNDLILGNAGVSALSVTTSPDGTGVAGVLTDGNLRAPASSGPLGIQSGSMTYNLGSGANGTGYNLTGIRSLTAWGDSGRINPNFSVSYSLDGVYFYPLATVNYTAASGASGTDVALGITGLTNVQSVKFDFAGGQQNGWVSYSELAVLGMSSAGKIKTPTQLILTSSANPSLLGTNVMFTATVSTNGVTAGDATSNLVFQVDGTAMFTNAVASGSATYANSTLSLGSHTITAIYRGDVNYAASTNTLTQSIYPAPVVTETDLSLTNGSFAPLASNDLILGNAGVAALTTVTYTGTATNLTDGVLQAPGSPGTSAQIVMIQTGTVTYNLGNGCNVTGIRSLTAWSNGTRINSKYTVSYSWDGTNYLPLATVNYAAPSTAKGTDVALAITGLTNVVSLQFNFPNSQQNSGVAYSELAVLGTVTPVVKPNLSAQMLSPGLTNLVLNLSGLVAGQSYTLQSSPSLSPAVWSNAVPFVTTQATAAITNATGTNPMQFFRLKY